MKRISIYIAIFLIPIFLITPLIKAVDDSELISLDLKGMDIRDVLKILSQKSGLNIVANSEVKGTVTLYLKDVSVMEALGIIASTNNLAYEQKGSLITLTNQKDYEKAHGKRFEDRTKTEVIKLNYANASEVAKAIGQLSSSIGKVVSDEASNTIVMIDTPENIKKMKDVIPQMDVPLATEVFSLDYAKAESLKNKISEMVSKGVGSVKFDEKTNKLVVKDNSQKMEDIKRVINAFDEKTREVLIDANIVQVTLSDKYSYGIDWLDIAKIGNVKVTTDTTLSSGLTNVTPSTLNIVTTGGDYSTVISLLETYGETNVLSRPRITVIDKQEAKILVGSKEVYVTSDVTTAAGGTYHTTDHVQFVDVGVRLGVVPEINSQGFITLKIKPEVSSADPTKTVELKNPDGSTRTIVPYVTTSEAETSVVVKDGTTIIIGGLMKDTMVDHTEKVPFFGDIPLIGKLFSATGKSKEKTELVIFLTPHIIEGDKTMEDVTKYSAGWRSRKEEAGIEKPKKPKAASHRVTTRPKEEKRSKWTPLFGDGSEYAEKPRALETKPEPVPKKTPYEEYYLMLRQDINDRTSQDENVKGIAGEVELQFTLDREGFLISGPIVLNKPDLRLVRSAVKTLKKAIPFPHFPKALKKEQAEFNIVVRYE